MRDRWPLLWLCGPSGVGKTTVGWEIFTQLSRSGTVAGYLDADQLGLCYPAPADDPQNHRVKARNLGAMARTLRAAGARCLVLSGGVQRVEEVRAYAEAVPDAALTLCRLRVGLDELRARFLGRGWRPELWEENAAGAAALDASDIADLTVDATGLSVAEVARRVREAAGGGGRPPGSWPGPAPASATETAPVPNAAPVPVPEPRAGEAGATPGPSRPPAVPVLWVCGPPGVGKSEVAWAVYARLLASGVTTAYVDLAQLGFRRPAPADDAFGHRLRARGLAAVWPTYRAAGARRLVLCGDVADAETVRAHAAAVPEGRLTLVRLHAGPDVLAERILARGRGEGPRLPGDALKGLPRGELLRRAEAAAHEARAWERAGIDAVRVATDGRTVEDVAAEVAAVFAARRP
ncbi:hypothetical protein ACTWP5_24890 [Streptomyces sp. 4N509B]|uniref:hypothetical protein n=1 Tax=Streptomyces sp. 4N509B TaxID=3457413 RepID=UPI003FD34E26